VALMTEAEFASYLEHLNAHPDPATGRPEVACAHCGQPLGDYGAFVPGHYVESGEPVLSALHPECEQPWRDACLAALEKN
jgi:hypothetical protein